MTEGSKLRPQRAKIVNLAVVANRIAPVSRMPRLDGSLAVDYFQPLSAEQMPLTTQRLAHFPAGSDPVQHRREDRLVGSRPDDEGNTAHTEDSFRWRYRARS